MIDPKILAEFEKKLSRLVGLNPILFDTVNGSTRLKSIRFGKWSNNLLNSYFLMYSLELSDCAWELWHRNRNLYTCLPDNTLGSGQNYLASLKNTVIIKAEFDLGDFSLTLDLDNNIKFKLLHSLQDAWHYTLSNVKIPTTSYVIKDGKISISVTDLNI
jgi:hypothetical protein